MANPFERTQLLLGEKAMEKLAASKVAVFGIGGVGGYVVEALARSGIGALDLIDHDRVAFSNLNRQIIATYNSLGQLKVEAAAERIRQINPQCSVKTFPVVFLPQSEETFNFTEYDYIVDAIDTVTGKLSLVEIAQKNGIPIISAMGAGNKLDPTMLEVADIYETSVCPLARVMRKELKKRGVRALKVVYSKEPPIIPLSAEDGETMEPAEDPEAFGANRRQTPGSNAFVPAAAGLIIAAEVVRDLTGFTNNSEILAERRKS